MKTKLLRSAYLLSITTGLLIFAGCPGEERSVVGSDDESHNRQGKHGIILRADIPDEKWTRIVEILNAPTQTPDASPRPKLYRIRNYSPGTAPAEIGELDDEMMQAEFPAAISNFKGHAVQIGLGFGPDFHHYPEHQENAATSSSSDPEPTPPFTSHAHFQQNLKESAIMVEAVDKILNESSPPSPTP